MEDAAEQIEQFPTASPDAQDTISRASASSIEYAGWISHCSTLASAAREVTVISGTFKVGMGDTFDSAKTGTFPAGSFALAADGSWMIVERFANDDLKDNLNPKWCRRQFVEEYGFRKLRNGRRRRNTDVTGRLS